MTATMSNTLINRIVTLSGPMPDETRFRRYLATLNGRQLAEREAAGLAHEEGVEVRRGRDLPGGKPTRI